MNGLSSYLVEVDFVTLYPQLKFPCYNRSSDSSQMK